MENAISDNSELLRQIQKKILESAFEGTTKKIGGGGAAFASIVSHVRSTHPEVKEHAIKDIILGLQEESMVTTNPWVHFVRLDVRGFDEIAPDLVPDLDIRRGYVLNKLAIRLSSKDLAGSEDTYDFHVYKWILLSLEQDGLIETSETSGGGGNVYVTKVNPRARLANYKKVDFYRPM